MKVDLPYTIKLNPLAVILGSFFILLIPFLLWSYFAKLEQISRANGQVIAVSKKQAIQSANDGVVKDIYVKEGQLVKKGEVIARLELSEFKADVEAIKSATEKLTTVFYSITEQLYKQTSAGQQAQANPEDANTETNTENNNNEGNE